MEEKTLRFPDRMWFVTLLLSALAVAVAFLYIDMPLAQRIDGFFRSAKTVAAGFASVILLGIEAGIALTLVISRIVRGHLSPFREATALGCLTSICAYAINDSLLKPFFGVPDPSQVLHEGQHHLFHLLAGSSRCGFPSGHMMLAGSFAGVFMRLYPRSVVLLSGLLLIAALLLILGDWHFVSDVIAGTFAGVSIGLLAGEVWLVHIKK
jgi:membrane-associated phospholipid phosphatase